MTAAEIIDDIAWAEKDLAEYIADGDKASAQDARALIKDLKALLAGDDSGVANEGIHSGGAYLA